MHKPLLQASLHILPKHPLPFHPCFLSFNQVLVAFELVPVSDLNLDLSFRRIMRRQRFP